MTAETQQTLQIMASSGCPVARIALRPGMDDRAENVLQIHPPSKCHSVKDTFGLCFKQVR